MLPIPHLPAQTKHGEQAGAFATLIVNDADDYFVMTDDGSGRTVGIHAFLISRSDGEDIKRHLPCSQHAGNNPCGTDEVVAEFGLGFYTRHHEDMF